MDTSGRILSGTDVRGLLSTYAVSAKPEAPKAVLISASTDASAHAVTIGAERSARRLKLRLSAPSDPTQATSVAFVDKARDSVLSVDLGPGAVTFCVSSDQKKPVLDSVRHCATPSNTVSLEVISESMYLAANFSYGRDRKPPCVMQEYPPQFHFPFSVREDGGHADLEGGLLLDVFSLRRVKR